jgi:hypothetical protein
MPFLREVAGCTAMDSKLSNALQRNWIENIKAEIGKGWKIHDECPNEEHRYVRRTERTCPVNTETE